MKNYVSTGITILVLAGMLLYVYGCPSKTKSLLDNNHQVTRPELQIELENITAIAKIRMMDLNQQDELKSLLVQNALVIFSGQPINPFGLLTGVAAVYGIATGGYQIGGKVKNKIKHGKVKNGTG